MSVLFRAHDLAYVHASHLGSAEFQASFWSAYCGRLILARGFTPAARASAAAYRQIFSWENI